MHHNGASQGILETDLLLRQSWNVLFLCFVFVFYNGGGVALPPGVVGRSYLLSPIK